MKKKKGFTLVELLAVIVILAIILVIAVPQIMKTIDEARKGALGSSAKLIAASAEREYLARETLEDTDFDPEDVEMECSEVAETTADYTNCSITFNNGKATVQLEGAGKFAGKYVCAGTRESATVTETACSGGSGGTEGPDGDDDSGNNESSGVAYIKNLLATAASANGLENPIVTNGEDEYNTGIRYTGSDPNNYVWFNCNPRDANGVEYGNENYTYDTTSCEKWRIIGVFDVEGTKRVKIINTSSTFKASWDSSASDVNKGYGINQWGATSTYEGADLMRLLNGYYIETNDEKVTNKSACEYCTGDGQSDCSIVATDCSLLKPLTKSALGMIGSAKWYTYATNTNTASDAYLKERGISNKLTGKECTADPYHCSDQVTRENEWTGKVGLMYLSDMQYANGWLYTSGKDVSGAWTISPESYSSGVSGVWRARSSIGGSGNAHFSYGVWPSVYLNSNIEIKDGDGSNGTATSGGAGPYVIGKMSASEE